MQQHNCIKKVAFSSEIEYAILLNMQIFETQKCCILMKIPELHILALLKVASNILEFDLQHAITLNET